MKVVVVYCNAWDSPEVYSTMEKALEEMRKEYKNYFAVGEYEVGKENKNFVHWICTIDEDADIYFEEMEVR